MKIEDLKSFDTFDTDETSLLKSGETTSKKYKIVVLCTHLRREIRRYGDASPDSYRVHYIKIPQNYKPTWYGDNLMIHFEEVQAGSELNDWKYDSNIGEGFECLVIKRFFSQRAEMTKSKYIEFNKYCWESFFRGDDFSIGYCSLLPDPRVRNSLICEWIDERIPKTGNHGCYGIEFGLYKINGDVSEVVRYLNTVYYVGKNQKIKSFYIKEYGVFCRKFIKTFDFSKTHFKLSLHAYSSATY